MFPRIVYESFRRQARRKLLAGIAITLGVAVATAMIAVATDIGDKINRELRSYGANLVVTPQEDTLDVEVGGLTIGVADPFIIGYGRHRDRVATEAEANFTAKREAKRIGQVEAIASSLEQIATELEVISTTSGARRDEAREGGGV